VERNAENEVDIGEFQPPQTVSHAIGQAGSEGRLLDEIQSMNDAYAVPLKPRYCAFCRHFSGHFKIKRLW
jgi:hypothetical protein